MSQLLPIPNDMKISVCIPCYNRPEFAREAIMSAWDQNPRPYEILLGDDSYDDSTSQIVEKLIGMGLPIRYFRHTPPLGQSRNVQHLFEEAEGDLVTLMHDDDRFRPGAFEALLSPLIKHPQIVASFGKQVLISDQGKEDLESSIGLNHSHVRVAGTEGAKEPVVAGTVGMFPNNGYLVRRRVLKQIDYHDSGRACSGCDWYFGFRLGMMGGSFYFVDRFTCDYRMSKESVGRKGSNSAFYTLKILFDFIRNKKISYNSHIDAFIKSRIKTAICYAASIDRATGWRWYFSRWHLGSICSPGGVRRFLILVGILKSPQ